MTDTERRDSSRGELFCFPFFLWFSFLFGVVLGHFLWTWVIDLLFTIALLLLFLY